MNNYQKAVDDYERMVRLFWIFWWGLWLPVCVAVIASLIARVLVMPSH